MAEIEIGILSRQALAKAVPDMETFQQQVKNWTIKRNSQSVKANWQYTTPNVQINLKRLTPRFKNCVDRLLVLFS